MDRDEATGDVTWRGRWVGTQADLTGLKFNNKAHAPREAEDHIARRRRASERGDLQRDRRRAPTTERSGNSGHAHHDGNTKC